MRSYSKLWVDSDYTGNGVIWYTENQGPTTTPVWIEYPKTKQDLVDALNVVYSALHRGVTLGPDEALFASRVLQFAYVKHPRKN